MQSVDENKDNFRLLIHLQYSVCFASSLLMEKRSWQSMLRLIVAGNRSFHLTFPVELRIKRECRILEWKCWRNQRDFTMSCDNFSSSLQMEERPVDPWAVLVDAESDESARTELLLR